MSKWYETEKHKLTGLLNNERNYISDLMLRRDEKVKVITDPTLSYNFIRGLQNEIATVTLEIDRAERREKKLKFRLQELEKIVHSIIEREGKQ